MKKFLKFIWRAFVWLFLIALLALLTLPLWISPVACGIANSVAPDKLGTKFHLGQCDLNPYNGKLTIGDLQVFNPPDCKQDLAFSLARLHVNMDMSTVFSDTVVIEEIDVREVFVSYVSNDKGENNFDIIMRNLEGPAGQEAKADVPTDKVQPKVKAGAEENAAKAGADQPAQSGGSRKFIVDRLHIEKVLVQWGPVTIPLPPITITGIGRSGNGVDWDSIWEAVHKQMMAGLASAGVNLSQFGGIVGDWAGKGAEHTSKALNAVKGISDGAAGAASSISDGTADALKTIKGLFD